MEKKKLIKVDFVKKKRIGNESEIEDSIDFGEGFKKFKDSLGESDPTGLMMELLFSGTMLHDKIQEIRRNTEGLSQNVLSEREENVRKYTNKELIYRFTKSNASEWHKNPAFYRAIANEILERLKMIIEDDK